MHSLNEPKKNEIHWTLAIVLYKRILSATENELEGNYHAMQDNERNIKFITFNQT